MRVVACSAALDGDLESLAIRLESSELGIAWNDPDIGIDWPVREPVLSAKDAAAQSLAEWLARPEAQAFRYPG